MGQHWYLPNLSVLILLLLDLVHSQQPEQYETIETNIYGKRYLLKTSPDNWYHGLAFCFQKGMNLLSIESKEENDAIFKFIHNIGVDPGSSVWTSGTTLGDHVGHPSEGVHGPYYWITTNKKVTFTKWGEGYPTNNITEIFGWEHCVVMRVGGGYGEGDTKGGDIGVGIREVGGGEDLGDAEAIHIEEEGQREGRVEDDTWRDIVCSLDTPLIMCEERPQ